MKKSCTIILIAIMFFAAAASAYADSTTSAADVKYVEEKVDLFGIKFERPSDWVPEAHAHDFTLTAPKEKLLQLVVVEGQLTKSSLDEFCDDFKDEAKNPLLKEYNLVLLSCKPMEMAGVGAYYIRFKSDQKDLGHILFISGGRQYALALKAPLGKYDKYEPILMQAAKTLSFFRIK